MNIGIFGSTEDLRSQRFYHGTRADLKPGDLIEPCDLPVYCALVEGNRDASVFIRPEILL